MSSIDDLKTLVSSRLGFARSNSFVVQLPVRFGKPEIGGVSNQLGTNILDQVTGSIESIIPSIPGIYERVPSSRELNILCKNAELPGKQIMTVERRHGMEFEKVAYGYAAPDVSFTFHLMNDYGVMNYLNKWRNKTINEESGVAAFKNDYATDVTIFQLRKPAISKGRNGGPINIDLDIGGGKVYGIKLIDAFPTSVSTINFSNELDGLVEVTCSLSYTNWVKKEFNALDINEAISANINLGQLI